MKGKGVVIKKKPPPQTALKQKSTKQKERDKGGGMEYRGDSDKTQTKEKDWGRIRKNNKTKDQNRTER